METIKSSRIIDRAKDEIIGFALIFEKLEQKVLLGGLSNSTLLNYGRCIAKISLHFQCDPTQLEEEQINGYLQYLLSGARPSKSYFKHTVYGLRFLYRMHDLEDRIIKLPTLKNESKLPVVLSGGECKKLFKSGRILKHRMLLSLIYSGGLRSKELRHLHLSDVDFDRGVIHIRQTKYNKDRYVPLSPLVAKGLHKYISAYNPKVYLFNGKSIGSMLSQRGVQWAMKETVKRSGIQKQVTVHSLRHSYATHLLEYGVDVDTVSKLLGHAHLATTLIYLHVARLGKSERYSPFDRLYGQA
jgi:site-specific recombinase XerD